MMQKFSLDCRFGCGWVTLAPRRASRQDARSRHEKVCPLNGASRGVGVLAAPVS
jgi:hypothetical protein